MLRKFEYYIDMNGDYGDNIEFEYEISDEQNEMIEAAIEDGCTTLDEVDGLEDLCEAITKELQETEEESLRENEIWTEDEEEEYDTTDPFEVFDLYILL
jgi:hypothetical protein